MTFHQEARDVLIKYDMTPESMMNHLRFMKTTKIILKDKDDFKWTFILRRNCHLYLMAKSPTATRYEDIFWISD
jgi:hypothetical protein